jgi:hypothetical protein
LEEQDGDGTTVFNQILSTILKRGSTCGWRKDSVNLRCKGTRGIFVLSVNLTRSTGQDLKIRPVDGTGSGSCPMTGIATSSVEPWNFATNVLKASELPYRNTHHVL